MKKLIVLMFLFFNIFVIAQESEEGDEFSVDDLPEQKDIFEGKTSIEKPTKLRDPFESPEQTKKKQVEQATKKTELKNGVYTNAPTLESITLDTVKVRGVLMGAKTRALIADKSNMSATILAKEGDKINKGKVELKAILPRGVVFVEQITNVYGQFEYLETVVPISD
jgi:Tfp pilus assembly protein PilP